MKKQLLLATLLSAGLCAQAQTLDIDVMSRGDSISDHLYGIFFEEINHAGDGGLYAELVANRSFEKNIIDGNALNYWEAFNGGTIAAVTASSSVPLLNDAQTYAVRVTAKGAGQGILNTGYSGIKIVSGETYTVSLFAKGRTKNTSLTVKLLAADKSTVLGEVALGKITTDWQKYTATITATGDADRGTMAVTADAAAMFYLDVVSLFPPTYKDRPNGMRRDLALALEQLHPAFVRFPGGCYVEGLKNSNAYDKDCHYEWKKTIGPIEERPGHFNNNWGYEITDGMGALEYLEFCEDLGAAPLYVTNIGIGHDWVCPIDSIDEYIQDALDFIEFANGDETTTWGKRRIELGHPEPFGLKLIEVGNENNPMGNDVANGYYLRYQKFYEALRAHYPEVTIIGNGYYNGTGWDSNYTADIVDEHYYSTPDFFIGKYNLYDDVSRTGHKRYVGEYAVTSDFGNVGNLRAALGEAVYMCGMERNSEAVAMASYAPIFQNDDLPGWWATEMIHFNNHDYFVTPSYLMQRLFPEYLGKQNVTVTESDNTEAVACKVGVGSYLASATYSDLKVTLADGTVITPDYVASNWTSNDTGTTSWTFGGSAVTQSDNSKINQMNLFATSFNLQNYTYELKATKRSGKEAFIIPFNYVDADNYCWLNVGGWSNTATAVEQCVSGTRAVVGDSYAQTITTGREYTIRIEVNGTTVKAYIDGTLVTTATIQPTAQRYVFTSATISENEDAVYLKVINPFATDRKVTIHMQNAHVTAVSGTKVSGDKDDENTWSDTQKVQPTDLSDVQTDGDTIVVDAPAYSALFLRICVDNTTGPLAIGQIETPSLPQGEGARSRGVYTLSGVKVGNSSTSLPRGIYIVNGQKRVVGQ